MEKATKPIVVNPQRNDPYKNFRFRMKFNGKIVAAADATTTLPRKITGLRKFGNITLKRGYSADTNFADWIERSTNSTAPKPLRRTFLLEFFDETGRKTAAWKLRSCSVSQAIQQRSKEGSTLETLTLVPETLEAS